MHDGRSPIIIDNTNIQAWEMKPYVRMVGIGFLHELECLGVVYRANFIDPTKNA